MQYVTDELQRLLADRLKLGEYAKPVCRVEVDRMAFIPGRTEDISFVTGEASKEVELQQTFIAEGSEGQTLVNYKSIVPPVPARGTFSPDDITSKFGMRNKKMHTGIDIGASVGETVVAVWSGHVSATSHAKPYTGYGYYIDVQHDNGVMTRYAHLSQILVQVGSVVQQGDTIGLSGNTGHVMSGGKDVQGNYDDPNSDRSKGKGAHLHFEIRVNDKPKDPQPYLEGTSKMFTSSTNTGGGLTNGATIKGTVGAQVFNQQFKDKQWINAPGIKNISPDAVKLSSIQFMQRPSLESYLVYDFVAKMVNAPRSCSFEIEFESAKDCILKAGYFSNVAEGLDLNIYFNNQLQVKIKKFDAGSSIESIEDVAFPAGAYTIKVEVLWYGGVSCKLGLNYIRINEVNGEVNTDKLSAADPTQKKGYYETTEIESIVFNEVKKENSLQVGQFVYMDTLVLDNIISVDIDDQLEMESHEARIVISNPDGYYSPDYNPFYFPEMYHQSPWSYYINGYHVGVLSENTPVRIYFGYGQNLIRVFTGLIDKVDGGADDHQLTITCRDMYKKVLNHVLLEDKAYPKVSVLDTNKTDTKVTDAGSVSDGYSGSRFEEIVARAKYNAKHPDFKGAAVDYLFLLAIAKHETNMGTTGAGRESSGGYILGYGVPSGSAKQPQYAGINKQLYFGAKRYAEALKSRSWRINSLEDVKYFWRGGDKGSYQWSKDTNWPNPVWAIYQSYRADPSPFADIPAYPQSSSAKAAATGTGPDDLKAAWLKSAVVTDLIVSAGMTGWRQAPSDIHYPDYVIEESYFISTSQAKGKVIRAVPNKEGEFEEVDIEAVMTPNGWLNPFIEEYGKEFEAFESKAGEAISEITKDTNYRSYCDRYGTYRLEMINMNKPIAGQFTEYENLVSLAKTTDWSRGRSHLAVFDDEGKYMHFLDTEILLELKGEVRTAVLSIPYAKSESEKRKIAERFFFDNKCLCRTLQISVPGNPALEVLDRVYISDRNTTTRSVYTIKGIKSTFSVENGYLQIIDLTWSSGEGAIL